MRSQIIPNVLPAVLLFAVTASDAAAGPGHFWTWIHGTVEEIDASHKILTLEELPRKERTCVSWDKRARWYDIGAKSTRECRVDPAALSKGQPVRVLCKKDGNRLLAVRIVAHPQNKGPEIATPSGPKQRSGK